MFRVGSLRFILDLDLDPSVTTTLVDVSLVLLQQVCHSLFPRVLERPVPDSQWVTVTVTRVREVRRRNP
jgi:hypothetical protein